MPDLTDLQQRTFEDATAATRGSYPPAERLTGPALTGYLDRRAFAVLATSRPNGRPHAAMSSYLRRDTSFWLPTVSGSVRERNLRQQPWASLVVTEGDHGAHVVVIVEGPVVIVRRDDAPTDVAAALLQDWVSVWLRLDAERVLSYAAGLATNGASERS